MRMKLLLSSLVVMLAMPGLQVCVDMVMSVDAPTAAHQCCGDDGCAETVSAATGHGAPLPDAGCCTVDRTPNLRSPDERAAASTPAGLLPAISGPSAWVRPADAFVVSLGLGPPPLSTVPRHLLLSVFLV